MELVNYGTYQQYKQELDTELRKTTEGFVRIGYLLKVAKDTDILRESGYANVYEFAQTEYNIDKSQVSRFININDRFSEGGYSERLKEQFQGFGHAKLAIMLQLPDEINEELTPEFSKAEIQAIKEEYDAEKNISDIEVLLEGEKPELADVENNLYKVLYQLGKEEPELYVDMVRSCGEPAAVQETLAPDGEKIYNVRIMGVGKFLVSVKDLDKNITLTNMRTNEKEEYSWETAMGILQQMGQAAETPEASWEALYGESFPKKQEVAPVQPKPQKKTKVRKAEPTKKQETKEATPEPEEQIQGQHNIMQYPEYLPDSMQKPENMDNMPKEEPQTPIPTKCEEVSQPPAAAVEDSGETPEDIWNNAKIAVGRVYSLFWDCDVEDLTKITKEELHQTYNQALSVAAALERLINHG